MMAIDRLEVREYYQVQSRTETIESYEEIAFISPALDGSRDQSQVMIYSCSTVKHVVTLYC